MTSRLAFRQEKHLHKSPRFGIAAVHGGLCGTGTEYEDIAKAIKATEHSLNAKARDDDGHILGVKVNEEENWLALQQLVESDWSGGGAVRVFDGGDEAGGR